MGDDISIDRILPDTTDWEATITVLKKLQVAKSQSSPSTYQRFILADKNVWT